jgi:hypothetical protein
VDIRSWPGRDQAATAQSVTNVTTAADDIEIIDDAPVTRAAVVTRPAMRWCLHELAERIQISEPELLLNGRYPYLLRRAQGRTN